MKPVPLSAFGNGKMRQNVRHRLFHRDILGQGHRFSYVPDFFFQTKIQIKNKTCPNVFLDKGKAFNDQ